MKKKELPKFYVMVKSFYTDEVEDYEVIEPLFFHMLDSRGKIKKKTFNYFEGMELKPVKTKSDLEKYIEKDFMFHYWAKCEWEFIVCDWPCPNVEENGVKVDVYRQLKANIPLITDIVWKYMVENAKRLNFEYVD